MGDTIDIKGFDVRRLLDTADWRPIILYDKEAQPRVLLRGTGDEQWTLGYWGLLDAPWLHDELLPGNLAPEPKPFWRKAIDWDKGLPVNFDPVSFAMVDERWHDRLSQD